MDPDSNAVAVVVSRFAFEGIAWLVFALMVIVAACYICYRITEHERRPAVRQ